jgi:hypothetical protein
MYLNTRSKDIDVAQNFKIIEWLKTELLDAVADLFKSLIKTGNDTKNDALASIIIITYLLGRRVGVSFSNLDRTVKDKLNVSIKEAREVERWYNDLFELSNYLENKKR